jgi:polar amino acid transport system ATP-binding protein
VVPPLVNIGLRVRDLTASYKGRSGVTSVLKGVSFDAMKGGITVIVGGSGAGKTTLVSCIAGLQPIDSGEVQFVVRESQATITCSRKRSLTSHERRSIGTCFQQSHLWSHMSVLDNLVHPQVWLKRTPRDVAVEKSMILLRSLRLEAQAPSQVSQLSGGQKQRVALLRSIAIEPEILLLDEITASQDPVNVQSIFEIVSEYVARTGCTALTISHDMQFVRKIADAVFLLENGTIVDKCARDDLAAGRVGAKMTAFTMAFEAEAAAERASDSFTHQNNVAAFDHEDAAYPKVQARSQR